MILNKGSASEMYAPISTFYADLNALDRKYTNPLSEEYFNRIESLYQEWLDRLASWPFEQLSQDGKIDYLNFRNHLNKRLYFHQRDKEEYERISHVLYFTRYLDYFISERRRALQPDAKLLSLNLEKAAAEIQRSIKDIASLPFFESPFQAQLASSAVESYKESQREAYQFYMDYDPDFTWWVRKSWIEFETSMNDYAFQLKKHYHNTRHDDRSGIVGKPLGRKVLEQELFFEFIPYSPEQLIAEAEKQYSWCVAEIEKAAAELGFEKNWKEALDYVKNKYAAPGKWPEIIVGMAEEAITFIEENDLMTIPKLAKETWRTKMMTAEQQKFSPFFLGGETILIAYPTSEMSYEEKMMSMRGNNPHFARAVVHHELIPGHHMQQFMNQRNFPYRKLLGTPFWTEGWALYWEFNLWDKSFATSSEDKIGMLFWRMHRAARIIFSLNYHLGKMTPTECIDFLVDKVGHERANAEAEVRRSFTGGYSPLYQIAYMIGGLQIYALKNELVSNGNWSEKDFHNFIISQNNLPIELLRARMTNVTLENNYETNWYFLDEK